MQILSSSWDTLPSAIPSEKEEKSWIVVVVRWNLKLASRDASAHSWQLKFSDEIWLQTRPERGEGQHMQHKCEDLTETCVTFEQSVLCGRCHHYAVIWVKEAIGNCYRRSFEDGRPPVSCLSPSYTFCRGGSVRYVWWLCVHVWWLFLFWWIWRIWRGDFQSQFVFGGFSCF